MKLLLSSLFSFILFSSSVAQMTVSVTVNSGISETTCDDGVFGGAPEPHWQVEVDGQGKITYPSLGICYTDVPNNQYNETFWCSSPQTNQLQICFIAFEDDGAACVPSESCLEQVCQNFQVPAPNSSVNYTLSIPNNGTNVSWGTVSFTISTSGLLVDAPNNLICDAIDLGTINSGSSLGDYNLSSYTNFCSNNLSEPSPWNGDNDQGVWFQFTTGNSPASVIDISANTDPQNLGDGIDVQLALYQSSTGDCSGTLTLIEENYEPSFWYEEMSVNCLTPNTTYFLLVDGEETAIIPGGQEGYFSLDLIDNGIVQGPDQICDALSLGTINNAGTVSTPTLSQSNVCAGNLGETNPVNWTNDQGVWYSFIAPISGHVNIDANSDLPFPGGSDAINLQLAVYESTNGSCSGTLTELASSYNSSSLDEDLELLCLLPGATYWILVDGSTTNQSGIFDISVSDAITPAVANFGTDVIIACDSLLWINGVTYYSDNNNASHTLNNIAGCDSIVTLDLTILNSTAGTDTRIECNSFTWINGITYTSDNNSATYNLIGGAANSCDSVVTLNLTIINSTAGTDTRTECDSLVWLDGLTYYTDNNSATYNLIGGAANSCDSLVTLDLTIINSTAGTDTRTECDSLVWLDGLTYYTDNNSATYNLIGGAANSCDSLVTLDLTIVNSNSVIDTRTECDSLFWIDGNTYYTSTTTPIFILQNTGGCDSILTLNLTINSLSDITTTVSDPSITVNNSNATYQWLDCNNNYAQLIGETGQSYTATSNGNYAIELAENGCIDTTTCVNISSIGVIENQFGDDFHVYPNPTNGNFSIDLGDKFSDITITIRDLNGKLIESKFLSQSQLLNLNIEEPTGVYILTIESNQRKAIIRVIKQ